MIPLILGPHLTDQKALIPLLAKEAAPLLIVGEEGVGKSLYARHIHAASAEKQEALPHVNLATCSEREGRLALLGSDFAKLTSTKRSLLEQKGIVLIQHINAASISLQEDLAQALRAGSFQRPGSIRKARVTCRAIFTLRETPQAFHEGGSLSPRLFEFLLSLRSLTIPPLRERPGDISAIAHHVLGRELTPVLEEALLAHPWPGNVTELRAYLLCIRPFTVDGGPPEDCLLEVRKILHGIEEGRSLSMKDSISKIESTLVAYALRITDGHQTRAARLLGISRTALRWHQAKRRIVS